MSKRLWIFSLIFALVPLPGRAEQSLTLQDALNAALTVAGLAPAIANVAAQQRVAQGAHALPTLGVGGSYTSMPQPGAPTQGTITEELLVDFGSPLGRIGQLLSARAAADAAGAALAQTRFGVAQSLIAAYFTVAADQAGLNAANESVALAMRSLDAAEERNRVGIAPLVDIQRARSALATAQADQASAQAAITSDRQSLAVITALPANEPVSVPTAEPVPADAAVTALALAASPAVQVAEAALRAAEADAAIAQGAFQPTFSVGGGLGRTAERGLPSSTAPAASAMLTIPIPAGSDRANAAASRAKAIAARTGYQSARRDALSLALALRGQATALSARVPLLQTAYENANSVAQAELSGYRLGAVSSADLITAQTQLASARGALATGTVQAARALALLKLQIGDGL